MDALAVRSACHHYEPELLPTQMYTTIDRFELESGTVLTQATVAFTVQGQMSLARDNVIVVCHALSGSADVNNWWSSIFQGAFRPALDLRKFCVVCCNCLGSPYGSSSPLSYKPGTSSPYGSQFPRSTIRDDVRIQKHVLDVLGVQSVYCVIGASMGGMLALEWALLGFEATPSTVATALASSKQQTPYVRSLVLISTAARQGPWAIAWAENQRATIRADARYRGGNYGDDPPREGLAAARMAAMLSYRTHLSFERRFGRRRRRDCHNGSSVTGGRGLSLAATKPLLAQEVASDSSFGVGVATGLHDVHHRHGYEVFLAQTYLRYQGEKFNARFDANCYIHILDKIDTHDVSRGRFPDLPDGEALEKVLSNITQRALVIGIPSDGLYPVEEQLLLSQHMPNATLALVQSDDGHDGFLLEGRQVNDLLEAFFDSDPFI